MPPLTHGDDRHAPPAGGITKFGNDVDDDEGTVAAVALAGTSADAFDFVGEPDPAAPPTDPVAIGLKPALVANWAPAVTYDPEPMVDETSPDWAPVLVTVSLLLLLIVTMVTGIAIAAATTIAATAPTMIFDRRDHPVLGSDTGASIFSRSLGACLHL
eukprot:comp23819_c0_seq1/m.41501 comp23819_c0_seq1/g.41501  ORF comp23819_c0_seq1/g.41501 comp23819_c0_seq1/m.41501 type:complete len:158 (+) comp23819_c0_seq1:2014-2487(+)